MNKNFFFSLFAFCVFTISTYAQQIGINEDASLPNPNAILDVKSSNKGILIPRLSSAERDALPAVNGLLVYDTTIKAFCYHNGTAWKSLSTGYSPINAWGLNGNATTDSNFLGTTDGPFRIRVSNIPSGHINGFSGNTFWGYKSGLTTTAPYNTAIGFNTLVSNTVGSQNTAVGVYALANTTTGNFNTSVGAHALKFNTGGGYNTAMGYYALQAFNVGDRNTCIGSFADAYGVTNSTALGYGAFANASNKIRLGNSAVTSIEGQVPFSTPSDGRFKYNLQEDVKGLDFILKLRPVTYNFDVTRFDETQRAAKSDSFATANDAMKASYAKASAIRRSGFIAQEVEKAAVASGYDFSGLTKPADSKDHYSLSYESFVVPMVKAMQEQHKMILQQQQQIKQLQEDLDIVQQQLQIITLSDKK